MQDVQGGHWQLHTHDYDYWECAKQEKRKTWARAQIGNNSISPKAKDDANVPSRSYGMYFSGRHASLPSGEKRVSYWQYQ